MKSDTDSWKLTAYALGELDEADQAEIEAQIANSPEWQREIEQIRATAGMLTHDLRTAAFDSTNESALLDADPESAAGAEGNPLRNAGSDGQEKVPRATKRRHGHPLLRRLRLPVAAAATIALCGITIYTFMPRLSRARELSANLRTRLESKEPFSRAGGKSTWTGGEQHLRLERAEPASPRPAVDSNLVSLGYFAGVTGEVRSAIVLGTRHEVPGDFAGRSLTAGYGIPASQNGWFLSGTDGQAVLNGHLLDFAAPAEQINGERYNPITENPFRLVESEPLSTFSIDVDTAAYANVRRMLNAGHIPPADAVRIEEMVNYFDYAYPPPTGEHPFSVNLEVSQCPWAPQHRLARIGIKGMEFAQHERPAANLVFLIDVSGSMNSPEKLPLVQEALGLLIDQLDRRDSIGIVVYAGSTGTVLEPTSGANRAGIQDAIYRLQAGGSTNGAAGIQGAYALASQYFIEGGVNRVILATDGDFNVGITGQTELQQLITEMAQTGIFLSVLGFGMGNLQDATLETLADKGNGNYAYIDTINEARKVLVDQMGGTLVTIAKDVKIQVEFNPLEVEGYRLVGYENRMLAAQDFNDDEKDAGEIGAGHTVTALYEIVPAGERLDVPPVDELKYQRLTEFTPTAETGELMTVKLRYKEPDEDVSKLIEVPVSDAGDAFEASSDDFAFAAAVASFGMLLRNSPHADSLDYAAIIEMAQNATGEDPFGYRAEFIDLVRKAESLSLTGPNGVSPVPADAP